MAIDLTKPWHYIANGQTIGPISGSELVGLIGRGVVQGTTKVWTPGQTGWVDASTYPDLFSASASMAPPPPTMADMAATHSVRHDMGASASAETASIRAPRPAGFWIRVVASLIDSLVISGLSYGLMVYIDSNGLVNDTRNLVFRVVPAETFQSWYEAFAIAMRDASPGFSVSPNDFANAAAGGTIALIIAILYYVILQGSPLQATIGKAIVGIRLRKSNGGNVGILRSFWRYLMTYVSSLLFGLGFLIAAFNREKRALHDFLAGTRVVYRKP